MLPGMDERRLKVAVQKCGRPTDPSVELLKRCGLKLSRGKDQLVGYGENMPLDVLFVPATMTFPIWSRKTCAIWGWWA